MSTTLEETKCQLGKNHDGPHDPIFPTHKCRGSNCAWCAIAIKCEYEKMIIEVWIIPGES